MNTTFRIGSNEYSVSLIEGLRDKYDLYGHVRYPENTIEIDADLAQDRKDNVLVHEILHAVLYEAGYDEHEEELVRRAANVLHGVLRENDFGWVRDK
jgi:uncharacterized tellurite resistance protein B-like protein